jgi:hypothetical protein
MNNQAAMGRGNRGAGRVKTPSRPPRFSKNSATQSQVFNKTTYFSDKKMFIVGQFKFYTRWNNQSTISHIPNWPYVSTCLWFISTRFFTTGMKISFSF